MFEPLSESIWLNRHEPKTRALITEHYIKLVDINAAKAKSRMPNFIEIDELKSMGAFGLLDAIDRFEVERGLKFETFASQRIYGSIIDGLRSQDWVPRGVRNKQKIISKANYKLEDKLLRSPSIAELAVEAGMSEDDISWIQFTAEQGNVLKLDTGNEESDSDSVSYIDTIHANESFTDTFEEYGDLAKIIVETINSLPEKQKVVLTLYYYQGFSLVDISKLFNITQSRVSQLYSMGIKRIYSSLAINTDNDNCF